MATFIKGRRYLCFKCGTLFLPDKPEKKDEKISCPNCRSKDVSYSRNVVTK